MLRWVPPRKTIVAIPFGAELRLCNWPRRGWLLPELVFFHLETRTHHWRELSSWCPYRNWYNYHQVVEYKPQGQCRFQPQRHTCSIQKKCKEAEHKEKNIGCIECESAVHHRFPWCDISAQRGVFENKVSNCCLGLRVPNEGLHSRLFT